MNISSHCFIRCDTESVSQEFTRCLLFSKQNVITPYASGGFLLPSQSQSGFVQIKFTANIKVTSSGRRALLLPALHCRLPLFAPAIHSFCLQPADRACLHTSKLSYFIFQLYFIYINVAA